MKKTQTPSERVVEFRLCGIPSRYFFNDSLWGGLSDKIPLAVRRIDTLNRTQKETRLDCAITILGNDKQKDGSWAFQGLVHLRKAQHLLRCSAIVVSGGPDLGLLTVTIPESAGI